MIRSITLLGSVLIFSQLVFGQSIPERLREGSNNSHVPTVKEFDDNWIETLDHRGEPLTYTKVNSNNFEYIGMPVGGLYSGQLYLGGDGRLWFWDIFNTSGGLRGERAYQYPYYRSEGEVDGVNNIDQGFAVRVNKGTIRILDRVGFQDIEFTGQYPIGIVKYQEEGFPVKISMEVFSPFIPLELENSDYPATTFTVEVENMTDNELEIDFGGWLQNAVCLRSREMPFNNIDLINEPYSSGGFSGISFSARDSEGNSDLYNDGGSMTLCMLDKENRLVINTNYNGKSPGLFHEKKERSGRNYNKEGGLKASMSTSFNLGKGEKKKLNFILSWYFPNSRAWQGKKRYYSTKFESSDDVAGTIISNYDYLTQTTRKWHNTWYNSSLPYWFLDRTFLNTSILATSTCQRYETGEFHGYEGGYQGQGTCTHVWGYVQAMGRLFPELEKILREKTDFVPFPDGGLIPESGLVNMRAGTTARVRYAVDGQANLINRCYLIHQMQPDMGFLERNYQNIKRAMNFMIEESDADHDGILTGPQHNTLDSDWYGKITWLSLTYDCALRSMAEMAREMGDFTWADQCLKIADRGKAFIETDLFNGEYFFHLPDPEKPDGAGIRNGCEYSQLLGQSWAYQLGLGKILDSVKVSTALNSLWKYNFTTDVGPYRQKFTPGRWYAMPGEGGLIACTWPNGGEEALLNDRPRHAGYNHECQNGYEYACTSVMMWHDAPYRALAHLRTMHEDRYHGSKRNPWCEVEWGIHYSRSMASYGLFTAACGYKYHGPEGILGFDPKIQENDFKAAFVSAEGWGTYSQHKKNKSASYQIDIKHGVLRLNKLELPSFGKNKPQKIAVMLDDMEIETEIMIRDNKLVVIFNGTIEMNEGSKLVIIN